VCLAIINRLFFSLSLSFQKKRLKIAGVCGFCIISECARKEDNETATTEWAQVQLQLFNEVSFAIMMMNNAELIVSH
jgi:hypothetical protein